MMCSITCIHLMIIKLTIYSTSVKLYFCLNIQVEEMTQTEAQWKDLPYAQRNKDLIRRWKQQIKVELH